MSCMFLVEGKPWIFIHQWMDLISWGWKTSHELWQWFELGTQTYTHTHTSLQWTSAQLANCLGPTNQQNCSDQYLPFSFRSEQTFTKPMTKEKRVLPECQKNTWICSTLGFFFNHFACKFGLVVFCSSVHKYNVLSFDGMNSKTLLKAWWM